MEKCYFEVGKTYVDEYRKEFTITEVRPHYPNRSTFDNKVWELPEGCENYYDIFTDRPHSPYWGEEYPEKYESFAQGSVKYNKLAEINDNPKKKSFICVVPGAHVICDELEENPDSRDYYEYACVWGEGNVSYYHFDRLTKAEQEEVKGMVERILASMKKSA